MVKSGTARLQKFFFVLSETASFSIGISYSFYIHRDYQVTFLDFLGTLFSFDISLRKRIAFEKGKLDSSTPGGHSFKTYFLKGGKRKSITLLESETNVDEEHGTTGEDEACY